MGERHSTHCIMFDMSYGSKISLGRFSPYQWDRGANVCVHAQANKAPSDAWRTKSQQFLQKSFSALL